jgi:cytochrome c oxidase assembly protein subunit 15
MNIFRQFSLLTTGLTYLLIFVGGLVRVAGAGMGCPDWPKCFDRWIPPTSLDQLPESIDPAKFNIVLAWIEYSNRLFGAFVGLAISITAFLAIKYYGDNRRILWPVLAAFFLTLVEGWLGSVLVDTVLNPITITLHLLLALIIVMLLIYSTQEAYYLENPVSEKQSQYSPNLKLAFVVLFISLLMEVILGTEIRGGLEMIRDKNPLIDSAFLLRMLGPFKYIHTILGFLITGLSGYLWLKIVKQSLNPTSMMVQISTIILVLIFTQIILGEILVFLDVIPLIQLFHMWIASWILGLCMVQYSAWNQSQLSHE